MRVPSLDEYELPGGTNQRFRVRVFVEIRQHFARRRQPIVADFGKNLLDGRRALGFEGQWFEEVNLDCFSDSWITSKVKLALAEDQQVKAREVNVETFKGRVQLSGFVISQSAMNQAVYVTSGIEGVTSVKNDMRIK